MCFFLNFYIVFGFGSLVGGEVVRPCNISNNQRYFACICVVCGRNVVRIKRKMHGNKNNENDSIKKKKKEENIMKTKM